MVAEVTLSDSAPGLQEAWQLRLFFGGMQLSCDTLHPAVDKPKPARWRGHAEKLCRCHSQEWNLWCPLHEAKSVTLSDATTG